MPSCFRKCMPAMDNVGIMLDIAKKPEAMKAMCQNLTESSKCAMATGCDATFVGALSNAFQFVCLDNLDKVTAQITCVKKMLATCNKSVKMSALCKQMLSTKLPKTLLTNCSV
ncbi:hypothetical protein B9Z55_010465 [Caenorhabditis nigoni]|nr:hypothetical protein B9Z55_010465 [Caenorhabditis nigoni]